MDMAIILDVLLSDWIIYNVLFLSAWIGILLLCNYQIIVNTSHMC
jgi:hypothetical protein